MIRPRTRPVALMAWIAAAMTMGIAACLHSAADEKPPAAASHQDEKSPTLIGVEGRAWRQRIDVIDDRGRIQPIANDQSLTLDDLLEVSFPTVAGPPPLAHDAQPPFVQVRWRTGTMLRASAITLENETAAIEWPVARQSVQCSIDALASIKYGAASEQIPENDPRWKPAIDSDRLLARDGDRILSITGLVSQIAKEYVEIDVEGQARRVPREALVAVVFAAPEAGPRGAARRLELQDGSIIETDSLLFANSTWKADLTLGPQLPAGPPKTPSATRPSGSVIEFPSESAKRVELRSTRVVWLSELEPQAVHEHSVAGRPLAWRRDRSVLGGPLRLGGVTHRRGLGVRARSVLEYNLPGDVESFVATVGIDDAAQGRGDCEVAVLGDGPEPLWRAAVRSGDAPRSIAVALKGVRRLTLVVEPGPHLDLADFVDWADARLVKPAQASPQGK